MLYLSEISIKFFKLTASHAKLRSILAHIFLLSCFNQGCSGLAPSLPGLSAVTLPPRWAPGRGDTRPPQAAGPQP